MTPINMLLSLAAISFVLLLYLVVRNIRQLINNKTHKIKPVLGLIMNIITIALILGWLFNLVGEFLL